MSTITNLIREAWDSLLGKAAIVIIAVGWVPMYLLSLAREQLTN